MSERATRDSEKTVELPDNPTPDDVRRFMAAHIGDFQQIATVLMASYHGPDAYRAHRQACYQCWCVATGDPDAPARQHDYLVVPTDKNGNPTVMFEDGKLRPLTPEEIRLQQAERQRLDREMGTQHR